ncbi:MAG: hypothetical protein ACJAS1_005686 [Oleiphilaceae bacterium]|jgi:hypothetical protein
MIGNNMEGPMKLYSQRAVSIATYIGGPLAGGILIRRNFINLGRVESGKRALFISLISTILLFTGIFLIPEQIIEKVPNMIIPLVYTAIITLIAGRLQGDQLKRHDEQGGQFYSLWKSTGIGTLNMLLILVVFLGFVYLSPNNFDAAGYDNRVSVLNTNEQEARKLFIQFDNASVQEVDNFISDIGIPAWEQNLNILNEMDSFEDLPIELVNQNLLLRKYYKLMIESYRLILKATVENTNKYDQKIYAINSKINEVTKELERG